MSTPRLPSIPLIAGLTTLIHVDWHFARPAHHSLSLGWPWHWTVCAAGFAVAGWFVVRRWSRVPWRAAALNVAVAILAAQLIEPIVTTAYYEHTLSYAVEADRWAAFGQCLTTGLLAMAIVMVSTRRRRG
jgi:hypothetical protein